MAEAADRSNTGASPDTVDIAPATDAAALDTLEADDSLLADPAHQSLTSTVERLAAHHPGVADAMARGATFQEALDRVRHPRRWDAVDRDFAAGVSSTAHDIRRQSDKVPEPPLEALARARDDGRLAVVERRIPDVPPYLVFLVDTPDRPEKVHIAVHGIRPEDYERPAVLLPVSQAADRYHAWYVEGDPS